MSDKVHSYSFIYNDIEKAEHYWNQFKPGIDTSSLHGEKWKIPVYFFEQISSQNSVLILLCDVLSNRFVYAVDKRNVVGYDPSLYLAEDGINFSIANVHPDFLNPGLIMQQKGFEYLLQNKEKQNKTIINYDGMYKKGNGEYIHFLQQVVCIEVNENGHPLLFLNYIRDITYLKKEKTAILLIIVLIKKK